MDFIVGLLTGIWLAGYVSMFGYLKWLCGNDTKFLTQVMLYAMMFFSWPLVLFNEFKN